MPPGYIVLHESARFTHACRNYTAAKRLEDELRPEIGFLKWKQSQSRSTETKREIEARLRLIEAVRDERVDVEAVAIIVGVK
jgi:hypothetical protein